MAPRLVIFDCDGVLVDSEMIASRVLAAAVGELGHPLSPEDCRARFTGKSIASVFAELSTDIDLPADFADTLRRRDRDAFAAELTAVAGVADALDALAAARVPVCVASSGRSEKIRHSLTITGLIGRFDGHLFSAEQVANGKPAPDLFLFAAAEMGALPADCVVIEDSTAGIRAARAAGMRVLGFAGASHCGPGYAERLRDAGAVAVFDDMTALPALLGI